MYVAGNRPERKDHYRGHKMSLWLNLIPQLHRPGEGDDISMRHHHFQEEDDQFYDGTIYKFDFPAQTHTSFTPIYIIMALQYFPTSTII